MGAPLVPRLPAEIQDEIIDCLSGQKGVLKQCATTSRRWAARAQKHLFKNIIIEDATRSAHLKTMLEEHPRLAVFVRELSLNRVSRTFPAEDQSRWIELLPKLDHLVTLTVGVVPVLFSAKTGNEPPHLLPHLQVLRLLGVREFADAGHFLRLLAALPSLAELYLPEAVELSTTLHSAIEDMDVRPAGVSHLHTLTIHAGSSDIIKCLLFYLPLQTSLRRLQLHYDERIPALDCTDLLQEVALVVEELVLRAPHHWPLVTILGSPVPFERLRYLHLKDVGLEVRKLDTGKAQWMSAALTRVSSWERCSQLGKIILSLPRPGSQSSYYDFNPDTGGLRFGMPSERLDPVDPFPFSWKPLETTMTKLAKKCDKITFTLNVRGKRQWWSSSTDACESQTFRHLWRARHDYKCTINIDTSWSPFPAFGGELVEY